MKTVLVVDDLQRYIDLHLEVLGTRQDLMIIVAMSLDELLDKYDIYRGQLDGIILDGCVPGETLNTLPFISLVKADMEAGLFSGVLMAASMDPEYREEMVDTGCTHEADKHIAAEEMLALIS